MNKTNTATEKTKQKFREVVTSRIWGMPYEEAVEKELLETDDCIVLLDFCCEPKQPFVEFRIDSQNGFEVGRADDGTIIIDNRKMEFSWDDKEMYKIRGIPITLSRLMSALERKEYNRYYYHCGTIRIYEVDNYPATHLDICTWNLLKPDNSTADENDQTEETLLSLIDLIK